MIILNKYYRKFITSKFFNILKKEKNSNGKNAN